MPRFIPALCHVMLHCLALSSASSAPSLAAGMVCGPEVITIGDAWHVALRQIKEIQQLTSAGETTGLQQKIPVIIAHLQFMRDGAIMVYGKRRDQLGKAFSAIESLCQESSASPVAAQKDLWQDIMKASQLMSAQFPEEALLPSGSFAHLLPPEVPKLHIQLEPLSGVTPGKPMTVLFQLVFKDNLRPVTEGDIIQSHGATLHALVCDRTLTDYHHEHPQPTGLPGQWKFTFTPAFKDQYHLWINAIPKKTGREEFPVNTLVLADPMAYPPPPTFTPDLKAEAMGLRASITWDAAGKLETKRPLTGELHIMDDSGQPIQDLEAYMEESAHIVGVGSDLFTIMHAHALKDGDDSLPKGPNLRFSMTAHNPGFYRLFVQIKRKGQLHTLPFGVQID